VPTQSENFVETISKSAAASFGSLASSYIQIAQVLWSLGTTISGQPGIDDVIDRLNELSNLISDEWHDLRTLILRETARIIEEVDENAQRQELAKATAAWASLAEYLRSGDREQLELSFAASAEPVSFFLLFDPKQTDTLAGFVHCVLIRVAVLRQFIEPPFNTQPLYIHEVATYAIHLSELLQQLVDDVEKSHVVDRTWTHAGSSDPTSFRTFFVHSQIVRDYSASDPNAWDATHPVVLNQVEYQDDSSRRGLPSEEQAAEEIERDRVVGVSNELDFLSVPEFFEVRDQLRALIEEPLAKGSEGSSA